MAVDVFLKLTDVAGESKDSAHAGEIDVLSYSIGVSNAGTSDHGGGSGAGRASFSDISLMKRVDTSSPTLIKFCTTGKHITQGILTIRKSGGDVVGEPYLVITLDEVLVTSVQESGSSEEPTESISLSFAKIHYVYKPQKEDGTLGAQVEFKYDLKERKVS